MPEASLAFFSVQHVLESSHPNWMAFARRDESLAVGSGPLRCVLESKVLFVLI